MMSDKLLSVEEAAKYLDYKEGTMYAKSHRKEIPGVKKRGRLYFKKSDLDNYMKKQEQIEMREGLLKGFISERKDLAALMQYGEMVTMFEQVKDSFSEEVNTAYLSFISAYSKELGKLVTDSYKRNRFDKNNK